MRKLSFVIASEEKQLVAPLAEAAMDCLWAGIGRGFGAQSSASLVHCHRNSGTFSVADILMADVLRLVDRFDGLADYPACRAHVARGHHRPSFAKAYADQLAHFARADAA